MMKNEVKLIVNGDDFGRLREVNQGIVLAFKSGLINQTTLMVNMPYADEAVNLSKEYGFFDKVGLHINLTEGIPLTAEICECERLCKDGEFRRYSIRDLRHGLVRLSAKEHCALEQEIHAQIDKYVELGFPLMHVDSHHHVHNEFPIAKIIIPYAKAKGFKSMRIARNLFPYNNIGGVVKYTYKSFLNMIIHNNFQTTQFFGSMSDFKLFQERINGVTEVMVHPILKGDRLYDRGSEQLEDLCKIL